MEWQAWATLGVLLVAMSTLAVSRFAPDLVLLAALTVLVTIGVVGPVEAFSGLSNEGPLTVAVLFAVAAGLRESGGVGLVVQQLLGRSTSVLATQARLMFPSAVISSVMNNVPLVASLLPGIIDWTRTKGTSASRLLLPLSYASILGGMCTLIGTSTNLVVGGLVAEEIAKGTSGLENLGIFDISWLGVPAALVGLLYVLAFSKTLLKDRRSAMSHLENPREYSMEMLVEPDSPLVGQTIEDAGLRHLPGLFLMEIDRGEQVLAAVPPQERLQPNDRLVFVGVVESVVDLQKIRGLKPATEQLFKLDAPRSQRRLIEAVVSDSYPQHRRERPRQPFSNHLQCCHHRGRAQRPSNSEEGGRHHHPDRRHAATRGASGIRRAAPKTREIFS